MRRTALALCCGLWLATGCGSDGGGGGNSPGTSPANVLSVSIGTSGLCTNINEPCAAVTVCQPASATCQTVPDLLLDTGSVGLRVFSSVLSIALSPAVDGQGRPLGECVFFADGGTMWGGVQLADIILGSGSAVRTPIHVVDPTFAGQSVAHNPCNSSVDSDPQAVRFNGILGLGLFREDCGPVCEINANNNLYFACSGTACTSSAVPVSQQVQNPV
ncbi:MAG TPA: DUF3443 family protein, partial [Nitrospira sp.]|nr:DUF3443 family protein [Nitrospira sp.]